MIVSFVSGHNKHVKRSILEPGIQIEQSVDKIPGFDTIPAQFSAVKKKSNFLTWKKFQFWCLIKTTLLCQDKPPSRDYMNDEHEESGDEIEESGDGNENEGDSETDTEAPSSLSEIPSEKIDMMIDLMNKLNKHFGKIGSIFCYNYLSKPITFSATFISKWDSSATGEETTTVEVEVATEPGT